MYDPPPTDDAARPPSPPPAWLGWLDRVIFGRPAVILPLALLLLAAALLIGCKDCEQLHAAVALARASGNVAAIEAAEQALAASGCGVPAPPPTPTPEPPPPPPPVNCLVTSCPDGQHCEQGIGCVPDPLPPPVTACSIDGEPGPLIPDRRPELGSAVNEAMHALRPDCDPGGRCVLTEGRQAWQGRVVAELRRRGACAGQHAPDTDEIAVATSATTPREGWHVYAGPWDGPGTIVWSPQAARPAYAAPLTAPPQPPPPTPPPGDACPAEPCPARAWTAETLPDGWGHDRIGTARWEWNCHESGRLWEDCTPIVSRDEPYCRKIGMSPMADGSLRAACPMRPDGHPEREAVERWLLGGAPVPDGPDCDPEGRPAFAVPRGSGACRLCEPGNVGLSHRVCSGRF